MAMPLDAMPSDRTLRMPSKLTNRGSLGDSRFVPAESEELDSEFALTARERPAGGERPRRNGANAIAGDGRSYRRGGRRHRERATRRDGGQRVPAGQPSRASIASRCASRIAAYSRSLMASLTAWPRVPLCFAMPARVHRFRSLGRAYR